MIHLATTRSGSIILNLSSAMPAEFFICSVDLLFLLSSSICLFLMEHWWIRLCGPLQYLHVVLEVERFLVGFGQVMLQCPFFLQFLQILSE